MSSSIPGYKLLDSGDGRKLEQFGDLIIDRPSSLSAWSRRAPDGTWSNASAAYHPPETWENKKQTSRTWRAQIAGVLMELEIA